MNKKKKKKNFQKKNKFNLKKEKLLLEEFYCSLFIFCAVSLIKFVLLVIQISLKIW